MPNMKIYEPWVVDFESFDFFSTAFANALERYRRRRDSSQRPSLLFLSADPLWYPVRRISNAVFHEHASLHTT